jgi:peptide/nickel transport system substrate-binding protein
MIVSASENHIARMMRPTVRHPFLSCLAALVLVFSCLGGLVARAESQPAHAIAMYGTPALPPDFSHLPYADPRALKGGRIVFGLQGTYDSLNAFVVRGVAPDAVQKYVLQSLLYRSADEPFTSYGLLARSVEMPEDRTSVTFHIDERARFSDGRPVTAADVLFSYELLKTRGKPFHRTSLALVTKTATPDALTVTFQLGDGSNRELPLIIGAMPIFASHATDAEKFAETTFAAPLGSGPYLVSQVKPGESLTLTRRSDFWAEDHPLARGFFNASEIRYDFYRDANSLFEAFKAGLYDIRIESDPTRWSTGYDVPAVREGRIVLDSLKLQTPKSMTGFVFNTRRPKFADIRVREALTLVFDFEWVNRNLFFERYRRSSTFFDAPDLTAQGRPANERERALLAPFAGEVRDDVMQGAWVPPASDGSGRGRDFARRALDLLSAAGYDITDGQLRSRDRGEPFTFEIIVSSRQQERLALNYAKALNRIGITTNIRLIDDVQYWRRLSTFDFDMIQWTWAGTPSPGNEQITRWGSASADRQGSLNFAGIKSPAADAMMTAMLSARAKEDFVAAVRALDRVLLSGNYVVPLHYLPETWVARSRDVLMPARAPTYFFVNETLWRSGGKIQEK